MQLAYMIKMFLTVWLAVGVTTAITGLLWTCKTSAAMLKEEKT